ncbi:MAG TPA: OmpA family protein, partial [Pirellulales bacterium]
MAAAVRRAIVVAAMAVAFVAGCAQNPYTQSEVARLKQAQDLVARQNAELKTRAEKLDIDNQDLETILAQNRQQSRLLEDEVVALRDQLRTTGEQLAQLQQNPAAGLASSRSGLGDRTSPRASIAANSSLRDNVPTFRLAGVEVRFDGDVVRIEMSTDRLFEPGETRMVAGAPEVLQQVAQELAQRYPDQIIGIEGHTDPDPPPQSSRWGTNQHISIAQATAVYDYLVNEGRI